MLSKCHAYKVDNYAIMERFLRKLLNIHLQAARPWEQCVAEMWNNDRPSSANKVGPIPPENCNLGGTSFIGTATNIQDSSAAVISSSVPSLSSQPQSAQNTLERVTSNPQSSTAVAGGCPQNPNMSTTAMISSTANHSQTPDHGVAGRPSQNVANVQPQSRDVTRVVKIFKQNELSKNH